MDITNHESGRNVIIRNTFVPHVTNKTLTIPQILVGLQRGVFHYDRLPDVAQKEVDKIKPNMDGEGWPKAV